MIHLRCLLVPLLMVPLLIVRANSAALDLNVTDESGQPIPCRMLVRGSDGKCVIPPSSGGEKTVTLRIGPDEWFVSSGASRIEMPAGTVEVRVEHGHEYRRYKSTLQVDEAGTAKTVILKRWIDLHERGYLCGDNHLHVDSRMVGPMAIAEGLDFGSSLTWWNGPDARRIVPEGTGKSRSLTFAGREVETSIHDAELEYGWGAAYIQNLPEPLPIPSDRSRPNLDYLRHSVQAGAIVHYQGGWSREVGLDALLGLVHTVNVCNNNFHLHKFQPRSRYSNLLKVDGFPVYPDSEEGMVRMNTDTYYRLLNWGLRLAAGAGSATGAKGTPVGYNRSYVRVKPGSSLEQFNEAWIQGKNFVTNGPMLFLATKEGHRPGDTLELKGPAMTELVVEAVSDVPLNSVEIVVNGSVVHAIAGEGARKLSRTLEVSVDAGSWIAARCVARDDLLTDQELAAYQRETNLSEQPSRIRFAHTSPIYANVGGKGARVRGSLEEGLKMMDALEVFSRDNCGPSYRERFDSALLRARETLTTRLAEASSANVGKPSPLAAPGITSLTNPDVKFTKAEGHLVTGRGKVRAIFVDNSAVTLFPDLPEHRAGYNGVASLTHSGLGRRGKNLFVPFYAGLNFEHIHDGTTAGLVEKFEPRKYPMELRIPDQDATVEVYQAPTGHWQLESCGRYTLLEDGTIEYAFECIPHASDYKNDFIGLFWASYIDQPKSKSIFFVGRPRDEPNAASKWIEGITPEHGVESTHGPAFAPRLPPVDADFPLTLVNHPSRFVYTESWFYGVSNGLAFVQMFRERDGIWFAQSPSGGGKDNPAWDFQWFIPNPKVGQAYGFVMRAAYVPSADRDEIIKVTETHRAALR